MSAAPLFSFGVTGQAIDDTSFSVFQGLNAPLSTGLVCGNFFLGLQASIAVAIPMGELLGLTRGGTVENDVSDAIVGLVCNGNWTLGGTIEITTQVDDSPRAGPLDPRLAWKPPLGFGPDWRGDFWGVFDQRLEDTGGAPFIDSGVGNSGTFGIRAISTHREQMSARFVVPGGPAWSVARALMLLRRHGNPIGSMEVAIQANIVDAFGRNQPSGIDLGVSAAVLNSTIPLTPGTGTITYAFAPDVVLPAGVYWSIVRPSVAYPVNGVDFIVWMQRRLFFGTGGAHRSLGAVRFDQGNYPGHADVHLDSLAKELTPPISWAVPAGVAGSLIKTPDLSPLLNEVIKNSGHETVDAICFVFRTVAQTRSFRFAAHGHPTRSSPSFSAKFRRRDTRGVIR